MCRLSISDVLIIDHYNERDYWITYSKCDLCKVCKIPELEFGN